MAKPAMVQTIQRILNEKEQATVADATAQQEVAVATKASGMPAPPSAQVMAGVVEQQNHQLGMQQALAQNLAAILQQKYNTPAMILAAQREQLAAQEAQIQAQIKAKMQQAEYAAIAPKETVQNSESQNYVDPNQMALLEQIYAGINPKKKVNFAKLMPMTQYNQPLQDYPGGIPDPNYDKKTRPLGRDTNTITEF